ncbi:MAG TPA: ATP-binding cassette domain-containing protein [Acidimicrobiales bacterium]
MSPRLELRGLTGGRGQAAAFRDLDLDVAPGAVLALLGPNGAGKTTLLLTLAGLLHPRRGQVRVDGAPVRPGRAVDANRAGIVLVPDNRSLFTSLTVEENLVVARPGRRRRGPGGGGDAPVPQELLDLFPALERRRDVAAGALSGGEQQMLAVARALVQRPKVLLVDEMSLGLAPQVVELLFATVRRIADDHATAVVLVEQHVSLALQVADEAAVLSRGAIVLRGPAAELGRDGARLEQAYFGVAAPQPAG